MNELIFFSQILFVIGCIFLSLKKGKTALYLIAALMAVFANLFVLKEIKLFGLTVTCSDVFAVGIILSLNFLQEFFGKEEAKKAVIYCFGAMFFFGILSFFHLQYIPFHSNIHEAYQMILSKTFRLIFASYAAFYISQNFDLVFFGFLKKHFHRKSLSFRVTLSLLFAQAIDTVLFSYLGLYGIVSNVFDVMFMSYLSKICIIFCSTPLIFFWRKYVYKDASI